jgi:plasmid stabilization system protein ParE
MSRYRLEADAKSDIKEIFDYIAKENLPAARRLRDLFKQRFKFLAANPLMGELREDLSSGVRILSVGSYVIVYYPQDKGIVVTHVVHGARDLEALLRRDHGERK